MGSAGSRTKEHSFEDIPKDGNINIKKGRVFYIGEDGASRHCEAVLRSDSLVWGAPRRIEIAIEDIQRVEASEEHFIVATDREAFLFRASSVDTSSWATEIQKVIHERRNTSMSFTEETVCNILEANSVPCKFTCTTCLPESPSHGLCLNCSMICHKNHSITLMSEEDSLDRSCECPKCLLRPASWLFGMNSEMKLLRVCQRMGLDTAKAVSLMKTTSRLADGCVDFRLILEKMSETSNNSAEGDKCRICKVSTINSVVMGCAHFAFCFECASSLQETGECPFCEEKISHVVKVFDS